MAQDLIQKFKNLPQDIKDAMFNMDSANVIRAVAKKYGLNIEQTGELADEAGRLMLGATHPRDFVANLNSRLATDPETTRKIAAEINEQIFAPIKESLKKLHGVGEELESRSQSLESRMPQPPEIKPPAVPKPPSPFEQKLVGGVEQAKKENRYPSGSDPYREPTT